MKRESGSAEERQIEAIKTMRLAEKMNEEEIGNANPQMKSNKTDGKTKQNKKKKK